MIERPPGWPSLADLLPIVSGIFGRVLFHLEQVRRGKRPPLGYLLAIELLIAVPMGYVGMSAGTWLHLQPNVAFGFAISISYLGPRLLEACFERWLERRGG